MNHRARLAHEEVEELLVVTRDLAAPFDISTMLEKVAAVARRLLHAERCSVWLHDRQRDELVMEIASDIRQVRIPVTKGLAGACAVSRALINVPDCYADPRFDASTDRRSGFHTRCSLTLPLIDHQGTLVGVMQLLNKNQGVFDAGDEALAEALAAQCAVALARARMTGELIEAEKLRQELELARVVQMSTLPPALPVIDGYEMHATFLPAAATGGDTYDLTRMEQGLLIVLADATGHGIAPALSVLQMHAMLRMALRFGADLETAFREVNDQLADTLPDGHFVSAFIGLLDADAHQVRFLSGGQGPILHFRAASDDVVTYKATSFPMGAMPIIALRAAITIDLAPGDLLVLLTDGIYEYENPAGTQFGSARVEQVLKRHHEAPALELSSRLLGAVQDFAGGAPQEDDITMVILKREALAQDV